MQHPHDFLGTIPERLPVDEVRRLSAIAPARALSAIAVEYAVIAAAIAAALTFDWWPISVLAIVLIGARQHALTIIAHDASHFRLLPGRRLNDWVGNVLLAWPMCISVQGFRHYHGEHHRHLNRPGDGNRELWHTHDAHGRLTSEWRYPKTLLQLVLKLVRRVVLLTGVVWLLRGLVGGFMFGATWREHVARVLLWMGIAWLLTRVGGWPAFLLYWVVPYCTWHVIAQYIRLVCEHSAVTADDPRYAETRSTIVGALGRLLFLPRNIGYHLEHHFYPSVPFYRLPELHTRLAQLPGYRAHANCERSILASLRKCVRP
jgi:fatty acid desaturase